jgi:hypothetical protein
MKAALAMVLCASFGVVSIPQAHANSALDQYVEEVPNPNGNDSNPNDQGDKKPNEVKPKQAKELKSKGEDGEALLALAEGSGPSSPPPSAPSGASNAEGSGAGNAASGEANKVVQRKSGDDSWFSAAADASGFSLPLAGFVVLIAAAMGGAAWYRRDRSQFN